MQSPPPVLEKALSGRASAPTATSQPMMGLTPGVSAGLIKLDRAEDIAEVGERQRGHIKVGGAADGNIQPRRPLAGPNIRYASANARKKPPPYPGIINQNSTRRRAILIYPAAAEKKIIFGGEWKFFFFPNKARLLYNGDSRE